MRDVAGLPTPRIWLKAATEHHFAISAATFDRIHNPAAGREGGEAGRLGAARLASGKALPDKGLHIVPKGDALVVELPGGGGFGDPNRRDAARVAEDKRAGLI